VSDNQLDSHAGELHPENDTGIIALDHQHFGRFIGGGVTGLLAAFAARNVA
jgi:hypothetical protein